MSSMFELGQKVVIFDFLVRTSLNNEAIEDLKNHWAEAPSGLTTGTNKWARGRQQVWIPKSVWDSKTLKGAKNLNGRYAKPILPVEGVIVQEVTLQDGMIDFYDEGVSFSCLGSRTGYKVSYSLRRKPLNVSFDMIREL